MSNAGPVEVILEITGPSFQCCDPSLVTGMNKTKVEWVKNPDGSQGYSWNPITGCLSGCHYCYARKIANGRLRNRILANKNLPTDGEPNHKQLLADPFYPRFWPDRLKELQKTEHLHFGERKANNTRKRQRKPKGIFVCNMCEMFAEWIPGDWQREIFKVIKSNPQDRFYFLTKRPWNLTKCSPFPDNCWIGSTVCDTRTAYHAWWYYFSGRVKAKLKYLSFEPLLENVMEWPPAFGRSIVPKADWIIIGSQTKPYNPPNVEWVHAIVKCADKAGKPVFIKNNLKPLLGNKLRQELPDC